ncbi:MAG: DedA family protein [Helicobacteraceae bacterium]|nr:DedA family protein [Helicobacteraceae bacterium]
MEAILQNLSESIGIWGYLVLFFYSLGGGFIALLAASILSSGVVESLNSLNIFISIFVAGIANFIGSSALCYISRFQKNEIMKYLIKHRRKIALAHIWVKKYDFWIIFIHKYLYGIKTIIPLVIGFSKYSFKKFIIYNFISSIIWAVVIGTISYLMGDMVKKIYEDSSPYIFPLVGIIIILLILILLNIIAKRSNIIKHK